MISQQQLEANQRNAQLSTGPKTPEGKAASARNAATHGLSSVFQVLAHEGQSDFDEMLAAYQTEFAPQTENERFLVQQLTQARWKMSRIERYQALAFDQLLDSEIDELNPEARLVAKLAEKTKDLPALLHRYAVSAERSYHRAVRDLTQARTRESRDQSRELRNKADAAKIWLKESLQAMPANPLPDFDPDSFAMPQQNEPDFGFSAPVFPDAGI